MRKILQLSGEVMKRASALFYILLVFIFILNILNIITVFNFLNLINGIFLALLLPVHIIANKSLNKKTDNISESTDKLPAISENSLSDNISSNDYNKELDLEVYSALLSENIEEVIRRKINVLNIKLDKIINSSDSNRILIEKINSTAKSADEGNNVLKTIIKSIASGIDSDMKQSRSNVGRINELFSIIETSRNNTELLKKNSEFLLIIMNTIDEISNKIHVLSINSSITAARAGDVGKPFMVIAKEIRKLSEDVKKSVEKMKEYSNTLKDSINIVSDLNETVDKETRATYEGFNSLLNRIEGFLLSFSVVEGRINNNNFNPNELINTVSSAKYDFSWIEDEFSNMKNELISSASEILKK